MPLPQRLGALDELCSTCDVAIPADEDVSATLVAVDEAMAELPACDDEATPLDTTGIDVAPGVEDAIIVADDAAVPPVDDEVEVL